MIITIMIILIIMMIMMIILCMYIYIYIYIITRRFRRNLSPAQPAEVLSETINKYLEKESTVNCSDGKMRFALWEV